MTAAILFLIYAHVADGFSKTHGFWKGTIWPYYVGVYLGELVQRDRAATKGTGNERRRT